RSASKALGEAVAVEDVVPEREGHAAAADELTPDDERLCESVRTGLDRPRDRQAERLAVPQQPTERLLLVRRGDQQDLPDSRQHEGGERIVDHRLVVSGQELLAYPRGEGVVGGGGATSQAASHRGW